MSEICDALSFIRDKIANAEKLAGRESGSTRLIAVSKTFDVEHIRPALVAGHKIFGENRVQEAQGKWPGLKDEYPDIQLHLIGPLQSNKAEDAVALFDVIHTIDREKIAKAIRKEMEKQGRDLELFVQVNTGKEPQKAGIMPEETGRFLEFCRQECRLRIAGLMCIPPVNENPGPHFALLRKLAEENGLQQLSMGMSSDFETAVEMGATYVRIGSAIFGHREYG
jgi:pyridoxal phosphate enzyme (YggS family)